MAITSGFFNSRSGDRKYDAENISSMFDGLINDGVYEMVGECFRVTPGEGVQVLVGSGKAWFNHTWTLNDTAFTIDLDPPETGLDRIDLIVLEVNHSEETRANTIKVVSGTPAVVPERPTLVKTEWIMQYPLAAVYVPATSTAVTVSNITNYVGTSECPFVIGVISVMTIDQIVAQWESQWADRILAREQAMDQWTADEQADFVAWENAQKAEMVAWENAQKAEMVAWVAGFENEANGWKSDWKDALTEWETSEKADFDDWFTNLQYVLDGDVAGHLQNEIDTIGIPLTTSQLDTMWNDVYGGV